MAFAFIQNTAAGDVLNNGHGFSCASQTAISLYPVAPPVQQQALVALQGREPHLDFNRRHFVRSPVRSALLVAIAAAGQRLPSGYSRYRALISGPRENGFLLRPGPPVAVGETVENGARP